MSINKQMVKNLYPLHCIGDLFDQLASASVFSPLYSAPLSMNPLDMGVQKALMTLKVASSDSILQLRLTLCGGSWRAKQSTKGVS